MKIVFVNSSLSGGGSEKVMTLLANRFAEEENYDVTMYLLVKHEEIYKLSEKVKKVQFKETKETFMRLTRLYNLRKQFIKDKPDVIVSFMSQINIYTLIASIGLKAKVFVSERNNPLIRKRHLKIAERLLYTICATGVIFQTEYAKKCFPLTIQKKSYVIPNPVARSSYITDFSTRKKKIVGVGRLVNQKNFSLLINAFSEFSKEWKDYTLTIYGDGPLNEDLKKEIQDLGLSDKVFLAGNVSDLAEKICDSTMYISSSNYEGISNAMLEALSMGIPTICTDCPVGGARQVIKNNVNGILIPVGSKQELVNAMKKIAGDEIFTRKLSMEAIKTVDDYSLDKVYIMWKNIIMNN